MFATALAAGLFLETCGVVVAGDGHGSYLPLLVCFAPLALLGIPAILFGGVPLYLAYWLVLVAVGDTPRRKRRGVVSIAVVHYGSLLLSVVVVPGDMAQEWSRLIDDTTGTAVAAVSLAAFAGAQLGLLIWMRRR